MKSEEDIKLKIVFPFLKDLGISLDEVSFETKFRFSLGTNVFEVGGKEKKIASGSSYFNNGYKRYHLTEHFDTTLLIC